VEDQWKIEGQKRATTDVVAWFHDTPAGLPLPQFPLAPPSPFRIPPSIWKKPAHIPLGRGGTHAVGWLVMNELGRWNVLHRVVVAAVRWWSVSLFRCVPSHIRVEFRVVSGVQKGRRGENEPQQKSWDVVGRTCLVPPSLSPSVGPYPLEEGRGRQGWVVGGSQWDGNTEERGKQTTIFIVVRCRDTLGGPPTSWVSRVYHPPPFPPSSELAPPTSLWKGEGWKGPRFRMRWGIWIWAHIPQGRGGAHFWAFACGWGGEGEGSGSEIGGRRMNINRDGVDVRL